MHWRSSAERVEGRVGTGSCTRQEMTPRDSRCFLACTLPVQAISSNAELPTSWLLLPSAPQCDHDGQCYRTQEGEFYAFQIVRDGWVPGVRGVRGEHHLVRHHRDRR